jgi:hypothetical protein
MSNVLSDDKRQQALELGRLGWYRDVLAHYRVVALIALAVAGP